MADAFSLPRAAVEPHRALVEQTIDGILESAVEAAAVVDSGGSVLYLTAGFAALTGQTLAACKGRPMEELKIADCGPIRRVLGTGCRQMAVSMTIGGRSLLVNIVPVKLDAEVVGAAVLVLFSSPAVLKRAAAALDRETSGGLYDQLTRKSGSYTFSDFVGDSSLIQTLLTQCERISRSRHTVLLVGETGVGKEIIAGGIFHAYSGGRAMPFIKINCSAIPRDLLESELFGHEKGAFTGAISTQKGKFELAAGGVLLLDEIGDMDLGLQSKLLRVIEEREFERIGGNKVIPLTARIIASTNQNLTKLAADGKFRMDLYYRLNTFEISVPPLRAHKSDIPGLIDHFVRLDGLKLEFTDGAYRMLLNYDWPGNVRELRNVLNRLSFLYPDTTVGEVEVFNATGEMFSYVQLPAYRTSEDPPPPPVRNLKQKEQREAGQSGAAEPTGSTQAPESEPEKRFDGADLPTARESERQLILDTLAATGYNLSKTAAHLGIGRSTLYSRCKRYGIVVGKHAGEA